MVRPIILFCNQRCGSTSFMRWIASHNNKFIDYDRILFDFKKFGYTLKAYDSHEIFDKNVGVFYDVIEQYNKTKDENILNSSLKYIFENNVSFKIILEETPWWFIKKIMTLIENHSHIPIFLYRESCVDRVLSLWNMKDRLDVNYNNFMQNNISNVKQINYLFLSKYEIDKISYEKLYIHKDISTEILITKLTGLTDFDLLRSYR